MKKEIKYIELKTEIKCPCGEELEYNKNSQSTDPWECPDKDCRIVSDGKGGVLVGKPKKY